MARFLSSPVVKSRFYRLIITQAAYFWFDMFSIPSSLAGLCVDGLYRVSGNLAVIQKLRFAVNHGESFFTHTLKLQSCSSF